MAATEKNLWDWLRFARTYVTRLFIRRTENAVSTGDADVDGVLDGRGFYLELKAGARPKRPSTPVRHHAVSDAQVEFGEAVIKAGGAHAYLIQVGEGRERRFYLVSGLKGRWLQPFRTEAELAAEGVEVYEPDQAIREVLYSTLKASRPKELDYDGY